MQDRPLRTPDTKSRWLPGLAWAPQHLGDVRFLHSRLITITTDIYVSTCSTCSYSPCVELCRVAMAMAAAPHRIRRGPMTAIVEIENRRLIDYEARCDRHVHARAYGRRRSQIRMVVPVRWGVESGTSKGGRAARTRVFRLSCFCN
jgi:hypothetical protein